MPALEGYRIYPTPVSRDVGKANCESAGGILATIHTREANSFLYDLAVNAGVTGGFWIGATRNPSGTGGNSDWSWDSLGCTNSECPTQLSFDSLPDIDNDGNHDLWLHNEPNNFKNRESCVRAGNADDGRWNDAQCSQKNAYMCYFHRKLTPFSSCFVLPSIWILF
jgi:hypothetical protein